QITVVPPPALGELYKEEAQPAYLFHRPPVAGKLEDLKGLKQHFARERVYLGDENITIGVPVGTDLNLIGVVEKDLVNVPEIKPNKDRSGASVAPVQKPEVKLLADRRTFEIAFRNLTGRQDFDIDMLDTDNVAGVRRVIIEPKVDTAPEV